MKWTAREVCRQLYIQAFHGRYLVVCPNTYWPGSETDLLVVRRDLRLMEVEIKVSRADLRVDARKEKWFDVHWNPKPGERWVHPSLRARTVRSHPRRIWKHYYCMPESVWKDGLDEGIAPASGIILLRDHRDRPGAILERQAKAAKVADRITLEELTDIARVQSWKMWQAFAEVDRLRRRQGGTDGATVNAGLDDQQQQTAHL